MRPGRPRRIGLDKERIRVRQHHCEEVQLVRHLADLSERLTEARLCVSGRMRQRHQARRPSMRMPFICKGNNTVSHQVRVDFYRNHAPLAVILREGGSAGYDWTRHALVV